MDESNPKIPNPPYLSYTTFSNFITALRATGVPGRIDKTVMGSMSGATQSSLLQTLKFLRLIDDGGTPTAAMSQLVKQPDAEPKTLSQIVANSYKFVVDSGIALETATDGQLDEVFRKSGLTGDTVRKAMTFFVLMATAAGMKVSPHFKSKKRKASGGGAGAVRRPRKKAAPESAKAAETPTPHQTAWAGLAPETLALKPDGSRKIVVSGPYDLSPVEIERISRWLELVFSASWTQPKGK